jgi:hypothetical protein
MRLITIFFAACVLLISCKDKAPSITATSDVPSSTAVATPTPELTTTSTPTAQPMATVPVTGQQPAVMTQPQPQAQPAQTAEPAQNAQGVWHFTCPKGCKGGAGANGPCPKCSTPLVHNQAYHAGATPPPLQATGGNPTIPTTASTQPQPQQSPEPAQNAKGVWHFTCPKGCAGGAGTTTACAKCGTTLAHNATYHQ